MGNNRRYGARELIDLVLDEGSYESWDGPIDITEHPAAYQAELRPTAERSGTDESVVTGRGTVRGRPVAFVVNEFRFLAGSIGIAAKGVIDAVVTAADLPALVDLALGALVDPPGPATLQRRTPVVEGAAPTTPRRWPRRSRSGRSTCSPTVTRTSSYRR